MGSKIALAGNPNSGKTTLFNNLTGSSQHVGNWPGVTVEKKEGRLNSDKDIVIQDLPGIYSLSPYSMEEVVSRNYLVNEKPDAIINIIDGTNVERNLYLTTQLLELNIPMVLAVNMMDVIEKSGDRLDLEKLSKELGCPVVAISALKGSGIDELIKSALEVSRTGSKPEAPHVFTGSVEHALAHIEESIEPMVEKNSLRWYAIKVFERDEKVLEELSFDNELKEHLEGHIRDCEKEMDDDAESIITNQRYAYIKKLTDGAVKKADEAGAVSISDKIDKIVTNRILALPIFAAVMFVMYYISVSTLGTIATDWTNDTLFDGMIKPGAASFLEGIGAPAALVSLIVDGIIGGVGTVLGFVPQMLMIFIFLAILEDSGYMARVAFIMDRLFRRFGLSGKSFIPILIGTGCAVPAIMGTRTIENERDRRMTIMLCSYLPCGAKTEIIGLIVAAFFPASIFMAPSMYFLGIAVIVLSGIALKKFGYFAGDPAPFVMELPAYHVPTIKGVIIHMWERGKAFMIKAGTVIFVACAVIWFLSRFTWTLTYLEEDQLSESMLAGIGHAIAWMFEPLGFGTWQGAVASLSAFVAKEQATGTLGILGGFDAEEAGNLVSVFTPMAGFSFMIFNLFNPPCLVAMVTAAREMGSAKWGLLTILFQTIVGYGLALISYQLGTWLFFGGTFGLGQIIALIVLALAAFMVMRPASKNLQTRLPDSQAA